MVGNLYNIGFWEPYIRNYFIKQIELLYDSIQNRLIPTFDNIEKEADEKAELEWERFCSSCFSPDVDPSDLAEKAEEAGIDHYMMLSNIKQTIYNITAITLYHLFEQQIIFLLRREILHPSQENQIQLMKVAVFREKLLEKNIDIYNFISWPNIKELKFVANSIKHAEGSSAIELRKMRPELFEYPLFRENKEIDPMDVAFSRVYIPLGGEDIFIIQEDILKYKNSLVEFWNELIETFMNYNTT